MAPRRSNRKRKAPAPSVPPPAASPSAPAKAAGAGGNGELSADMKNCLTILDTLMAHEDAGLFLEPVDWKAYGLNDYPKKIKKPMDLGTIKVRFCCASAS